MSEPEQGRLPLACPTSRAKRFAPITPGPYEGALGANREGRIQEGIAPAQGQRKRLSIDTIEAATERRGLSISDLATMRRDLVTLPRRRQRR